MAEARAVWRSRWYDRTGAALYDFAVERESLARVLGLLIFGTDARLLYGSMSVVAEMPDSAAILDAPCGGGLAFRALGRRQRVRYVAADLSRGMLRRARRVAERRGLGQIEFVEADRVAPLQRRELRPLPLLQQPPLLRPPTGGPVRGRALPSAGRASRRRLRHPRRWPALRRPHRGTAGPASSAVSPTWRSSGPG
jgi:SAM-dependent methyltransferase